MENGLPDTNIEPGSLLDLRLNKGMLPTLDIAGHTFYVDLRMDKLRLISKGINFTEIKDYYDSDRRAFVIPYNPSKRTLDPIGKNKSGNLNTSDYLKKHGVHLHFEAKVIP